MTSRPRHPVSVAAIISDDAGNVLVTQRRDNGRWEPPGGILEVDETVEDGLRREVREETGVEITPGPLTGVYKDMRLGVVALVFRAYVASGTPGPTEETQACEWWSQVKVAAEMAETISVRVLDAFREDGPLIRAHDGTHVLDPTSSDRHRRRDSLHRTEHQVTQP